MDKIAEASKFFSFHPLTSIVLMVSMALLPFLFLSVTSFVKISVVFNILRNAIGATQVPSGAITSLISIVLTLHIMAPVGLKMVKEIESTVSDNFHVKTTKGEKHNAMHFVLVGKQIILNGSEPLIGFMRQHSNIRERKFFATGLKRHSQKEEKIKTPSEVSCFKDCPIPGENFASLMPAFLLSELKEAFIIGFMIFLPFLAIDIIISNILIAMGMTMLTPVTVSLPFKLLLFVISDAWYLLCRSLIMSY